MFGWSFYRQGTSGGTSSADEFLDAALTWFGDPDPRLGTAGEKGERLANFADIADREGTSALRRDLEQLSSDAGAKLLRTLGVEGR